MAHIRAARPLVGALGVFPVLATSRKLLHCEEAKSKPTFQSAKCTRNEAHTSNTRLITLALPDSWNSRGPIANVVVRASLAGPGESGGDPKTVASKEEAPKSPTVARPYNPLSSDSGNSITLLVKKYDGSKMGSKLHSLKVNDTVEVRGPNKQWTFEKGKYKQYAMVAGGTGITPLIQATDSILRHDTATVTMLTFNKTAEDVLLSKELAKLEVMYPGRLKVQHFVDANPSGTCLEGSPTSAETLKASLPPPGEGVLIMVCGRKEMTAAVAGPKTPDFKQGDVGGVLKDLGYSAEQVWKV